MSVRRKLLLKLLDKKRAFSFNELESLLMKLGYVSIARGKTSGSRMAFESKSTGHIILLHRPHKSKTLKPYLRNMIINELKRIELI